MADFMSPWWANSGSGGPPRLRSRGEDGPAAPDAGQGWIWYDGATQKWVASENGGAPIPLVSGGGDVGGSGVAGQVAVFDAVKNITSFVDLAWDNGAKLLTLGGDLTISGNFGLKTAAPSTSLHIAHEAGVDIKLGATAGERGIKLENANASQTFYGIAQSNAAHQAVGFYAEQTVVGGYIALQMASAANASLELLPGGGAAQTTLTTIVGSATLSSDGELRLDSTGAGVRLSGNLGFYGTAPIAQPGGVADPAGGATVDAEARTAVTAVITRLENLGLIATV